MQQENAVYESIDDGDEEESLGEECNYCHGSGMTLSQNGDDENDRDFDDCPNCQGTGYLTEQDEEDLIDEN